MPSYFEDVGEFHRKFGLPHVDDGPPVELDRETLAYRTAFMLEELCEFSRAASTNDLPKMLDALVDLAYIAIGTAHFKRLPFDAAWAEVHRANMAKERGPTAARGHHLDVRKPDGWMPPDIEGVIEEHVKRIERKEGELLLNQVMERLNANGFGRTTRVVAGDGSTIYVYFKYSSPVPSILANLRDLFKDVPNVVVEYVGPTVAA